MTAHDGRENTGIDYSQAIDAIHLQEGVHDTTILPRRHARRGCRMVYSLDAVADERFEFGIALRGEVVVEQAIRSVDEPSRVEHVRQRFRAHDRAEHTCAADEDGYIMLARQVSVRQVL